MMIRNPNTVSTVARSEANYRLTQPIQSAQSPEPVHIVGPTPTSSPPIVLCPHPSRLCYADTSRKRCIRIRHVSDTDTPLIHFQTYPGNTDTFCVGYVYPTRLGQMGYSPNHQSAQLAHPRSDFRPPPP